MTRSRPIRRLGWALFLGLLLALLPRAGAAAAPAGSGPPVVIFAVPGLQWSDAAAMPTLQRLAAGGAVGELSVRTAATTTYCASGDLVVSAGNRALAPYPTCVVGQWQQLRQRNLGGRFAADVGALGKALHAAGVATVAASPQAAPMLARDDGRVDQVATRSRAIRTSGVAAILDPRLFRQPPGDRQPAARAVDADLARVVAGLPAGTVLVVAGTSDSLTGGPHLHPLVISGPGWSHRELRSPSTGRAPFVQLIDLAPTILEMRGITPPSSMVGRPMTTSGAAVRSMSSYVDDDRHAVAQRGISHGVLQLLGGLAIILVILAFLPMLAARRTARLIALALAPAPAIVFLANALPWWRWGALSFFPLIVAGAAAVGAGVAWLRRRRGSWLAITALIGFIVAVLALDQLTGSHLQLSAPLADNPTVAGRFRGMGNLDFAAFTTATLLLAALLAGRLPRRQAVLTVAGIGIFAVVIDGAPPLGDDFGGVIALVPSFALLAALVAGARITIRRVIAVIVGTAIVAIGVALADYSRPAADQTHVGRFVGQVLHGGAWTVVHRKLQASVSTVGFTIGTAWAARTAGHGG